jgi:hypothetical protein
MADVGTYPGGFVWYLDSTGFFSPYLLFFLQNYEPFFRPVQGGNLQVFLFTGSLFNNRS